MVMDAGLREAPGVDESSLHFRAYYLRSLSLTLNAIAISGVCMQLGLSHLYSPFGAKSRAVNSIYMFALCVTIYNVHAASSTEQLSKYVGVPLITMFCLTRVVRLYTLSRSSAKDAAAWLNIGRSEWGATLKAMCALLLGMLLTMMTVGLPLYARAGLIIMTELLRILLYVAAVVIAGPTRRIATAAAKQIVAGWVAFAAGIALSWLHEATVLQMWERMQSLEACASSQSLVDQQCLLALFHL